jgi:hypothetical protein
MLSKYKKILAKRKLSVLCLRSDNFACGHYRVIWPYEQIKDNMIDFHIWDVDKYPEINFVSFLTYDAVLLQRPILEKHPLLVQELKKRGIKVVIENDDRLDMVHRENPAFRVFHNGSEALLNFLNCVAVADGLTVSTPELAKATLDLMRVKNKDLVTCVLENSIDLNSQFYKIEPKRKEHPENQVNVMWSGSSSHFDSLRVIKGVVEHAIDRYDNAKLVIAGNQEFVDMFPVSQLLCETDTPFLHQTRV